MKLHCTKCGQDSPIAMSNCSCPLEEYMIQLSTQETIFPNVFLSEERIVVWVTRSGSLRWVGLDSRNRKTIFQASLPRNVFPIPINIITEPAAPFTS